MRCRNHGLRDIVCSDCSPLAVTASMVVSGILIVAMLAVLACMKVADWIIES